MTFEELKQQIEKMPIESQKQEVKCWGEESPLTAAKLAKCVEDMYFNSEDDWEYCVPKSDIDEDDINNPNTELYAEKGTYYLWVE